MASGRKRMNDDNVESERLLGDEDSDTWTALCNCDDTCWQCEDDTRTNQRTYHKCSSFRKWPGGCNECRRASRSRATTICRGASNILSVHTKDVYIKDSYLVVVCVVLLLFVLFLLFMFGVHLKHPECKTTVEQKSIKGQNLICKNVTVETSRMVLTGQLDGSKHNNPNKFNNPKKNIFYVVDEPLNIEQACTIETLLRILSDKQVYVIEINDYEDEFGYITFLQKRYTHLSRIRTNKMNYFEGSLFENYWNHSDNTLINFAARVLAVWEFGGVALSQDLFVKSRNLFDRHNDKCVIEKDIIYCPHECSEYTYNLMKQIINALKSNKLIEEDRKFEKIIESSLLDVCGDKVTELGCDYVLRLQTSDTCDGFYNGVCQFLHMDKIQKLNRYHNTLKHFCHYVGRALV